MKSRRPSSSSARRSVCRKKERSLAAPRPRATGSAIMHIRILSGKRLFRPYGRGAKIVPHLLCPAVVEILQSRAVTGAMSHLAEFLGRLREDGFELAQEFPSDCVPILRGEIKL